MLLHDLIDDALALLGVIAETQEASPEQCELCIRKLNAVLAQWELDQIDLQWSPVTMADLSSQAPLEAGSELAVTYYLAFAVAPHFRRQVTPEMLEAGAAFFNSLQRRSVIDQIVEIRAQLPRGEGQCRLTNILTDD